jgi:hypothetical protein
VKASARFVSTVNRFGIGRGKVAGVAMPSLSCDANGTGAPPSRSPLALGVAALAGLALLLAVVAPAASAAPTATSGYGLLTGGEFGAAYVNGFSFNSHANRITTDSHGNIFLGDEYSGNAAVFAPDPAAGGTFLTNVPLSGVCNPGDVAIDPSTDALYVQPGPECGGAPIKKFVSDGKPTPTYTLDPSFEAPSAIHTSAGASPGMVVDSTAHNLLVADPGTKSIKRYSLSTGALVSTIPAPSMIEVQTYIASAPDGSIYLAQQFNHNIVHLSAAGAQLGEIANVGESQAKVIVGLAVNPATGVLVAAVGSHLKGYSPTGGQLYETVMPNAPISIAIDGNTGRLYAYTGAAANTFVPAVYPGVEAPVVSDITPTGAHVSVEVDPGKEPDNSLPSESVVHFEYITKTAYDANLTANVDGFAGALETPDQPLSGPETREADVTGLEPNLDYLVRAKASNSLTFHLGTPTPFHTTPIPPKTETNDATDVSETKAVLNGTINPVGLPTTYHFEYGSTTAYGSRAPAEIEAVAGADRNDRRVGWTITGLTPGTTYHFRLVATSHCNLSEPAEQCVAEGDDHTFTTPASGTVPRRAYEQVTPVDKGGIPIKEGLGFQAESNGAGLAYSTQASTASAPILSRSMSLRGSDDWSGGLDLDPPLNEPAFGLNTFTTLGVSADFTHSLVATNRKLTSDAVEDDANRLNLYVVNLKTGQHTLVVTAPDSLNFFIENLSAQNFIAGAPDFSWLIFRSPPSLKAEAPGGAIYRWSAQSGLSVVSVLPQGGMAPVAPHNSAQREIRTVSADGTRVYFTVYEGGGLESGVFLRENADQEQSQVEGGTCTEPTKACTIPISVSQVVGDPKTPLPAQLIGASEDGRFAYFYTIKNSNLTGDSPDEGGDAYRYDHSDDSLIYIGQAKVAAPTTPGGNDQSVLGVGSDGQTAYWIAPTPEGGVETVVWRHGVLRTVTDVFLGGGAPVAYSFSPDGRYAAYTKAGNVYFYDSETGERDCVSCYPDGSLAGGYLNEPERWLSNHSAQQVTDGGQVFFTSSARLVAADANGTEDVYEYEDGHNALISPGNAPFAAKFADASEDGSNVFFTTGQKLVGQDNDRSVDIYDARINGGLAKQNPPPPQECLRDDCKATPGAGPELPFGGSEALGGPGNVGGKVPKRCPKGTHARKVKGKSHCVKANRRRKSKHTKKGNTNRRQGR